MRRINPIATEADDIVRVVRRLEDAIRALHQVADLLPLLVATKNAEDQANEAADVANEQVHELQDQLRDEQAKHREPSGKEDDSADPTGQPEQRHRGPGEGSRPAP